MNSYVVTKIDTGEEVYRYFAAEPIEWQGMEFSTHHHTIEAPQEPPPEVDDPAEWRIYVGPFFDRFGAYKMAILASTDPMVQAAIKDASVRKCIDLKVRRADLQQMVSMLQLKGFPVSASAILDVKPVGEEVFRV